MLDCNFTLLTNVNIKDFTSTQNEILLLQNNKTEKNVKICLKMNVEADSCSEYKCHQSCGH